MTATLTPAAWRRVLPFVLFMVLLAIRGHFSAELEPGVPRAWDPQWIYGLSVLVVSVALAWNWRHYEELHVPRLSKGAWLASALVGVAVFKLWVMLDSDWMLVGTAAARFRPVDAQGHLVWSLLIVRWLGASLMVPVMEELFWRSFLMRWIDKLTFETLDPAGVSWRAIALSTLAFATVHVQWFAAIVAGLAYALLYRFTRNLWASIAAHAVTNGVLGVWVVVWGNWAYW